MFVRTRGRRVTRGWWYSAIDSVNISGGAKEDRITIVEVSSKSFAVASDDVWTIETIARLQAVKRCKRQVVCLEVLP